MVDEAGAGIVEEWLKDHGVQVSTATSVASIADRNGAKVLHLENQGDVEADFVVMATGIRPNLGWLEGSGLAVGSGILVDDHCRTNVANIFAAGDVAEGHDRVTGRRALHAIEPTAMQHGRVAAANMGGVDTSYGGSLSMNIVDVLDLEIASFGDWDDPGAENFTAVQRHRFAYRKLAFRGGRLVGGTLIGKTDDIWSTNDVGMLKGLVYTGADLSDWKEHLRGNPFDIRRAFLATETVARLLPDMLLGRPSVPARQVTA